MRFLSSSSARPPAGEPPTPAPPAVPLSPARPGVRGAPLSPSPRPPLGRPGPAPPPEAVLVAFEALLRRGLGAVVLLGIALTHALALPAALREPTRYPAAGHGAAILAAVVLAEVHLRRGGRGPWLWTAGLAVTAGAAAVLVPGPRWPVVVTGVPGPLPLASALLDVAALLLAVTALVRRTGRRRRPAA